MAKDTSAFIDRIEGEFAVLVDETGREWPVPASWLPEGASEGQWLRLGWALDEQRTEETVAEQRRRRRRLMEGDDGGDLAL